MTERAIGISDIFTAVRRHIRLIGLCFAGSVSLGALFLLLATPAFVATTQIFIKPEQRSLLRTDNVGLIQLDTSQLESQLQVIKSERIARYVVRAQNLIENPDLNPAPSVQITPIRQIARYLLKTLRLAERTDPSASRAGPGDETTESSVMRRFISRLGARRVGQSYVIEVSFWARDQQTAVHVVNAVTAAYIRNQIMERLESSNRGNEILEGRINSLRSNIEYLEQTARKGLIDIDSLPSADGQVISSAALPLEKSWPSKALVLVLAAMVGLLLGGALTAICAAYDDLLRSVRQVEDEHGISVIGTLPRLGKVPFSSALKYVQTDPHSAFSSDLQRIKTELDIAMLDANIRCIGFVSADPEEGKSVVLSNLGHAFAAMGRNTLLIDCDVGNRSLSSTFAEKHAKNLADLLSRSRGNEALISIASNLTLLPLINSKDEAGSHLLLGSALMQEPLALFRSRYDVVLVDLPAMSVAGSARAISPYLDAIVIVAKLDATSMMALGEMIQTLNRPVKKTIGIVVNTS